MSKMSREDVFRALETAFVIQIPIRDEDTADLVEAFCTTFGYQTQVQDPKTGAMVPNPMNPQGFVIDQVGNYILAVAKSYMLQKAQIDARTQAQVTLDAREAEILSWFDDVRAAQLASQKYIITAFADTGNQTTTVTTGDAHGLANATAIAITGTTHYDGIYSTANVTINAFDIATPFVGNDGMGGWELAPPHGAITAFADAGNGSTTVTSAGHGLQNGDCVVITGTTSYNVQLAIQNATTDTFDVPTPFVANDATGMWRKE